jgi:Spherulation-specific family 4/Secretion system C-terminal sorting domain
MASTIADNGWNRRFRMIIRMLCFVVVLLVAQETVFCAPLRSARGGSPNLSMVGDTLNMKVLVPAYFDPSVSDGWTRLKVEAGKLPGRIYAIANLDNGPGSSYDASYGKAISDMHDSSGKVIGYVYTNYGAIPLATAKSDIDSWFSFYPTLDGIFLDCQSNLSGQESYYLELYNYIKQKNSSALVVANPGTNTLESFLIDNGQRVTDVICIFESDLGFDTWTSSSWCHNYDRGNFYVLPYNTTSSQYVQRVDRAISLNIGWIYCTSDMGANPWDTLPLYFEDFCNYVATGTISPDSSHTVITIDGNFNDWLNVPKLNEAPNPPAQAGDSPDPNADYVNFWAADDTTNFYLSYQVAGTLSSSYFYRVFLDVDSAANTGFRYHDSASIAAGLMIENDHLYRYAGTGGTDWTWTESTQFAKANQRSRVEMSIPLAMFPPGTNNVRLLFEIGAGTVPYGTMEIDPEDYKNQFYAYSLGNVTGVTTNRKYEVTTFGLDQNYPNPFNPTTIITYQLSGRSFVSLTISNILGQQVRTLVEKEQPAGQYSVVFNSADGRGSLPSGVYFYRLQAGGVPQTKKMILLK